MPGVEKYILKVKKKLTSNELEERKILKYLRHLDQLEVNVDILKNTGIGKIVNALKKHEGVVCEAASSLVTKWKNVVISNQNMDNAIQNVEKHSHSSTATRLPGSSSLLNSEIEQPEIQRNRGSEINGREKKEKDKKEREERKPEKVNHTKTKAPSLQLCDISFGCEISKETTKPKKKHRPNTTTSSQSSSSSTRHNSSYHHSNQEINDYSSSPYLPPLPSVATVNEALLPDIQPTYKPSRLPYIDDSPSKKRGGDIEGTFVGEIKSKKSKTQVFSGRKHPTSCGIVTSLFDTCVKVLLEHIDALHDTGGVPYDILLPVLSKCNPQQLIHLEECNPYFIEESDELWQAHYRREFKGEKKVEGLSWRDSYLQKFQEREEKLEKINAKISAAQAAKKPERQVKLAFVMTEAKPPPQIRRKQARYGTGHGIDVPIPIISPIKRSSAPKPSHSSKPSSQSHVHVSQSFSAPPAPAPAPSKPARRSGPAPMMKKTMKLLKNQRNIAGAQIKRR